MTAKRTQKTSRSSRPAQAETSGLFIPRFPQDLRRRIRIQALLSNLPMPDWMVTTLHEAVEQEERRRR